MVASAAGTIEILLLFSFRDPLFSTISGHIFRKGYEHTAKVDNELMWLYALGLQSRV